MSKKIGKSEKSKKGGHWPDRGGHAGAVARRVLLSLGAQATVAWPGLRDDERV